ncbi:MAG: M48 family metalloprotease [Chloroflexota bacterium]
MIIDFVRQTIVHSLCVLLFVEVLLRLWDLRGAAARLQLRLLPVFLPLVAYPLFLVLAPQRGQATGLLGPVLLDSRVLFDQSTLVGSVLWIGVMALVCLALALFALQLVFFLWQRAHAGPRTGLESEQPANLRHALIQLRSTSMLPLPAVTVLDEGLPVLYTVATHEPKIVVSRGLLASLDAEELLAALAHEVAHTSSTARRLRWLAWLGRALAFYSPISVIVLRQALHEVEAYCDEQAGRVTGLTLACASALLKVWRPAVERSAWTRPLSARLYARAEALQDQGEQASVVDRSQRLLQGLPSPWESEWQWLRLLATVAAALLMLYFVI